MKSILLFASALSLFHFSSSSQGFVSDYAVANWTTTLTTTGNPSGAENTGSVDISNAPGEVTLIGSDGPTQNAVLDVNVDFTITTTTAGQWSFDWSYTTTDDSAQFDPVYVIINNTAILLTDDEAEDEPQSGTFTSPTPADFGDVIGFRMSSAENAFGNAQVTISNFSAPSQLLPVTYSLFTAIQQGEQVKLEWSTATEINNDRFYVERSTNGRDFISLQTIPGTGNSSITQYYEAIDNNPDAINYYRIKQVDLDGNYTYSDIKVVRWVTDEKVKLYPNPARTSITLRLTPDRNENTSILLIDGGGKIVKSMQVAAVAGSNITTDWDINVLPAGVYFFKVSSLNYPLRFMKQ